MKVLCFGAGAIGTYLGGSLALAGEELTFLEQPAALAELRTRGLRLDLHVDTRRTAAGALILPPSSVRLCESLNEALEHGPFDAAIFARSSRHGCGAGFQAELQSVRQWFASQRYRQ
jgi:2-dehydropantoate 2-reductase